jgi:hypothetical protein
MRPMDAIAVGRDQKDATKEREIDPNSRGSEWERGAWRGTGTMEDESGAARGSH